MTSEVCMLSLIRKVRGSGSGRKPIKNKKRFKIDVSDGIILEQVL